MNACQTYMVTFSRTVTRRIAMFGATPEDALAEARALLDSGIDATRDLYDEDSYVVAESAALVDPPASGNPYTDGVLFDNGRVETLQPTEAPYVWEWRGDQWACCGACSVVVDGPRIETDRPWVERPPVADLDRISALIDRATVPIGPWESARGRWESCFGMEQDCAVAGNSGRHATPTACSGCRSTA